VDHTGYALVDIKDEKEVINLVPDFFRSKTGIVKVDASARMRSRKHTQKGQPKGRPAAEQKMSGFPIRPFFRKPIKEIEMNYNDYIQFVRERAGIKSEDAAKKAIESVLEVVGQRITLGQAEDIAAALPPELRPYLRQTPEAEAFDVNEFLKRISDKEGVDVRTAEGHARAVLSVLGEWIPRAELRDTLEQIPNDMRNLFYEWVKKAA
jgi:uncharacterized protein (DUF2267 family)